MKIVGEMLKLSNRERAQLREALTSSYRSYSNLKIFVSDNFDYVRLDEVAESRATRIASENLIVYFEEVGDLSPLILALYRERQRNPEARALFSRLRGFMQQYVTLEQESKADFDFDPPTQYDDLQLESFLSRPLSYDADLGVLRRGLLQAKAVCRLSFEDRNATGVLVAPGRLLTNYHVLSRLPIEMENLNARARELIVEFGCVSEQVADGLETQSFRLQGANPVLAASPVDDLDYVLLKIGSEVEVAGYEPAKLPLDLSTGSALLQQQDSLNVLHHPSGSVMQVSLSSSGVVEVDTARGRVLYVNRTYGGSSGSPCFDRNWQMVALHHASRSRSFGSIREGILLSSILAEVSDFLQ